MTHTAIRGVEFVSGQRGTGKTTYIRTRILNVEPRLFVYDHMAEFRDVKGAHYVHSLDEAFAYLQQNGEGFCRCVYVPLRASVEEFRFICRIPFAHHGLTLVCDEIDQFARPLWPPEEFRRLIHFGRHFGCSFVGASRRPADVSRAFTSQAKRYVCFRQTEPKDLQFLRSVLGNRADDIKQLPPLHYIAFEEGRILRGTVKP